MAALQITYGGSSYNVTRLDVIDLIPFEPVFLQDAQKLLENNVTRLDIIDTSSITAVSYTHLTLPTNREV